MAFFERTTRKGSTEKLNLTMGAADSTSTLSVREKIYLAVKKLEINEPPPNGLTVNETFVKEMFTLHVKSVDAAKDLQKKLEESNLLLALERIKCQDKDKRIQELNSNVSQLETDLQQEKEAHERVKIALDKQTKIAQQQYLKLQNYQQNTRKQELLRSQQDNQQQNLRQKQQNLVSKNHTSKSSSSTNTSNSGSSKNSSENSVSQKRGRGASTATTKPRTYRRHRNSRGPPLLSPAITPDTPFRNSKSENTSERALDQNEQSQAKEEEDEDELPSDVEAGSVNKPPEIVKPPVIEESSPPLYRSSFIDRPTITAASVLKSLGKNYSYDPKLIGDISNEIHQTLLNETLENESAKERAKRSRRTSSKRSRSSSSEGESKTRRCRKSRAKSDKTSKTTSTQRECLFDSGNTKQLLQRLDKLCQNSKSTEKSEILESIAEKGAVTSTMTNLTKQNTTFASNLNSLKNNSAPVSSPVNSSKPRGRRRKIDTEDKCNEGGISTKNIIASKTPTRTITTRNSVAKNNEVDVASVSSTSSVPISKSTVGTSQNVNFCSSLPKSPVSSSISSSVSKSSTPVATAAVSKVNEPVSSAAAAIPKANSPGTSASAVVYKSDTPSTTATTVSLVPLSPDITRSLVPKGVTSLKNPSTPKSLFSTFKTPDSSVKSAGNSENKTFTPPVKSSTCTALSFVTPPTKTVATNKEESSNKTVVSILMTEGVNNKNCETCIDDLKSVTPHATYSKENICNGLSKSFAFGLLNKKIESTVTSNDQVSLLSPVKTSTVTTLSNGQLEKCMNSTVAIQNGNRIRTRNDRKSSKSENSIEQHYSSDVSLNQKENCMTTVVPYFVLEAPVVVSKKKEKRPPTPKETSGIVEVPSWREKQFKPSKVDNEEDEEIEDLDDSVFLKRHQRPEIDEKRRKRWDSQRMREETYLERLKRRMAQREKQTTPTTKKNKTQKSSSVSEAGDESDDDMESFQPAIEDIRYIRIEDDIPIGTFGYPMPIVAKGCFDLPWSPSTATSVGLSPSKPTPSTTGISPNRRNGTLTINGHGAAINVTTSCCNSTTSSLSVVTSPSSGNSSTPGPSCGNSTSTSGSSNCSAKNSNISTGGPSASTRLSSKR